MEYKLLTPGPLTTTETVKQAMLQDYSTWDVDYKEVTQSIRRDLLKIAQVSEDQYTTVLMQGSGTFGVESVLTSVIGKTDKVLICANGAYGLRMAEICEANQISYTLYEEADDVLISAQKVKMFLDKDPDINFVSCVHNETTTGIMNDIQAIGEVVKSSGATFIVDAMSSFGAYDIPVNDWNIDFIISSSNKCIQGVPGFSFTIARKEELKKSKGKARTLSLDLYDQWETMDIDGKWRYTSPTHTVMAFRQALDELKDEGGVSARYQRYLKNNQILNKGMAQLGFETYIDPEAQGPFISTFLIPDHINYNFDDLYNYVKERGYVIYPGKLTERESFRIGNIGEIYPQDMKNVLNIVGEYMEKTNKNYKLVVFDWAGTIVDFGCMAPVEAFRQAFEAKDIEVTEAEIREPMGMSKIDHVRTMLGYDNIEKQWKEKYSRDWTEEDVEEIYEISNQALLNSLTDYSEPKPYVLETFEALREAGIAIGSTSGYTKEMMAIVRPKAEEAGLKVDHLATSEDTNGLGRPYPYMIFNNVQNFKTKDLDQVIKVGDTVADIEEGKNANVLSVGIIDGSSEMGLSVEEFNALSEEELDKKRKAVEVRFIQAGADVVIQDMRGLLDIIG